MIGLYAAAGGQGSYNVLGLPISAHFVPFGSLILTSVLIPRASFLGHLAGIIVGYAAAFGAFAWMTPFWTLSLALWAAMGVRRRTASTYNLICYSGATKHVVQRWQCQESDGVFTCVQALPGAP